MTTALFGNPASVVARQEFISWAEGGEYYKATNTTVGTGIAAGIVTSFTTTTPLLTMVNGSSTKLVIPHYLRLINTAAGASSVSGHLAITVDTISRYSSGASDLTTLIKNARSDETTASAVSILRFGAVTNNAASAERVLARTVLKTQASPCWVVGDEVTINFLSREGVSPGLLSGTVATSFTKNVGPIVLGGASHSFMVHQWNPSNATTPPSWEMEIGWYERPRPG